MLAGIQQLETILLLLLVFVVALTALANSLEVPYPTVVLIAGLVLCFIPRAPRPARYYCLRLWRRATRAPDSDNDSSRRS